jgi:hypothetical protein
MKTCKNCSKTEEEILFPNNRFICVSCVKQEKRDYYIKNRKKTLEKATIYREINRDKLKVKAAEYRKNNPEKLRQIQKRGRVKNKEKIKKRQAKYYRKNKKKLIKNQTLYYVINKNRIAIVNKIRYENDKSTFLERSAFRRAALLKATPTWLTKEQRKEIRQIYKKAKELSHVTGIVYEIDHIIPLQGEEVCGLHVPWNLQIITFAENRSKSNKILLDKYSQSVVV